MPSFRIQSILGKNWKTNGAAIITFLMTVKPLVDALTAWAHHQPADWRMAAFGTIVALGLAAAKDSTVSSTPSEVAAAGRAETLAATPVPADAPTISPAASPSPTSSLSVPLPPGARIPVPPPNLIRK